MKGTRVEQLQYSAVTDREGDEVPGLRSRRRLQRLRVSVVGGAQHHAVRFDAFQVTFRDVQQ